jgi:hypothetical protein
MNINSLKDHPDFKRIVADMTDKGYTMEQMRPVTGLPYEEIARLRKDAQDMKKKKRKKTNY